MQFEIGMKGSFNGLWADDWLQAQRTYFCSIQEENKSAMQWLLRVLRHIQQLNYDMWKQRNDSIHEEENSRHNKARHEELNEEIRRFYHDLPARRFLPHSDAHFFARGAEKIKQLRLSQKELWVDTAFAIRDAFITNITSTSERFMAWFDSQA